MDPPSSWLQELEMQDQGFMNQCHMNKVYYQILEGLSVDSFSSDFQYHKCHEEPVHIKPPVTFINTTQSVNKKLPAPSEKPKPKLVSDHAPSSFTISFGDVKPKDELLSFSDATAGKKKAQVQVQDHILAERKRRQKLAQRFSSLSSLLPDLKKMDKASVLEDAANYIQELQNRVKELEKNMQESVITRKRSRVISSDDSGLSSDEANFDESRSPCDPEIEVRSYGCSLLVEIYGWTNCISLVKALSEMQKLGLSVTSCSTMPFADSALLVTIVAEKNDDFIMSLTDVVKNLRLVV